MTEIERQLGISDYLTVGEAAVMLGVSSSTLRNWDKAGRLKPFRHPINGYRLYHTEDLRKLLAQISGLTESN